MHVAVSGGVAAVSQSCQHGKCYSPKVVHKNFHNQRSKEILFSSYSVFYVH